MFKNAAKVQLIFCVCLISIFYSLYTIYLIWKKRVTEGKDLTLSYTLFLVLNRMF